MSDWVIFLEDDLRNVTVERAHEITRLCIKHTVVVFKNQRLTPAEEIGFVNKIGNFHHTHGYERSIDIIVPEQDGILRVTGKKNERGNEGLFGHKEALDWHANQTSNPNRMPLIWLYGVESTKGSRTSYINMIKAYDDLDESFKEEIKDIRVYCGYKKGSYSSSDYFKEHVNKKFSIPLVYTNDAGQTGLYFPFLQIFEFEGDSNKKFHYVMERLKEHVLQEKYMYHHDWDDGDVVIAEQWLGVHKRWAFENMEERVLHRIAFNYEFLTFVT
jgi:taurine dioxygenase